MKEPGHLGNHRMNAPDPGVLWVHTRPAALSWAKGEKDNRGCRKTLVVLHVMADVWIAEQFLRSQ